MTNKKLAIIFGGESSEHEASLKAFEWMYSELQTKKLDSDLDFKYVIFVSRDGKAALTEVDLSKDFHYYSEIAPLNDLASVLKEVISKDLFVYTILQGQNAEDGRIQGTSELLKINGVFGNLFSCAISMSKYHLNRYIGANFSYFHIPESESISSIRELHKKLEKFTNREIVIKPNALGASIFTERMICDEVNFSKISTLVEKILEYDNRVLIQEYISGQEHACGCIEKEDSIEVLPVMKIETATGFFGHDEKHKAGLNKEILLETENDSDQLRKIKETCKEIFLDLGFQNMCRFDLIIQGEKVYFLEINSFPGLMRKSLLTQMLANQGISVVDLINMGYRNFLKRNRKKTFLKYQID